MDDNLFLLGAQSSLVLGLIHGINPCGHSWLVLAPFVSGEKQGWKVAALTLAFIGGTSLACLVIGLGLGLVSAGLSESIRIWADMVINVSLIFLGMLLLVRPELLHGHDHGHGDVHDHDHGHHLHCEGHIEGHGSSGIACSCSNGSRRLLLGRISAVGLFLVGFVNMIIPCPSVAIMYSYALESGSVWKSAAVFLLYALTTGIAIGSVIYAIFRISGLVRRLNQHWIEPMIMRVIGVMTMLFAGYSLMTGA